MCYKWSGIPDSNWRPSAWQADALPTELIPQEESIIIPLNKKVFKRNAVD